VRRADNVLVRIETDNGVIGWCEAASAPVMTGETLESIVSAVLDSGIARPRCCRH
jgi:L-alanine-DL-glutamate epimerase-like enolase superfamily enzyme